MYQPKFLSRTTFTTGDGSPFPLADNVNQHSIKDLPIWNDVHDWEVYLINPRSGVDAETDNYNDGKLVSTEIFYADGTGQWDYLNPTTFISEEKVNFHYRELGSGYDEFTIDSMYLNMTDGTSRDYLYGANTGSDDILSVEKIYSGPDETGALKYKFVNLTNGTSRYYTYYYDNSDVLSEEKVYSGPDATGSLQYKFLNLTDGTSRKFVYGAETGRSDVLSEVFTYSGPNQTGTLEKVVTDTSDGGSSVTNYMVGGDVLEEVTFYSGPSGLGSRTSARQLLTNGDSRDFEYYPDAKRGSDDISEEVVQRTGSQVDWIANIYANGVEEDAQYHYSNGVVTSFTKRVYDAQDNETSAGIYAPDGTLLHDLGNDGVGPYVPRARSSSSSPPVNDPVAASFVQHLAAFGVNATSSGVTSLLAPPPAQDNLIAPSVVH